MQVSSINIPPNLLEPGHHVDVPVAKIKADAPAVETVEKYRPGTPEAGALIKLQSSLAEHNISLKFSKDETTKALVVELIDDKTGEQIRQFPTEVSLKLAANFIKLQGQFVDNLK